MSIPKKCGEIYIQFDENKEPLYGFELQKDPNGSIIIVKFIKMTDKNFKEIVLPKPKEIIENTSVDSYDLNDLALFQKEILAQYLNGNVIIENNCFDNIHEADIVIPFNASVLIKYNSFNLDSKIKFVLNNNLELKNVTRVCDLLLDEYSEYYLLICNKNLTQSIHTFYNDYIIKDYNTNNVNKHANFTTVHNQSYLKFDSNYIEPSQE